MSSKYLLEQAILDDRLQIPITEERFNSLGQARRILTKALDFEQRYELLLGNFIAMELAFTEISLRAHIELQYSYADLARTLEKSNLHLVNLLTAMRAYADQVVQDFKCLETAETFRNLADAELRSAFERSKDYRFMHSLRNHVQHKAAAIHSLQTEVKPTDNANGWVDTVRFYAHRALLSQDSSFKRKVLEEWTDKIDVRSTARGALKEIGAVHLELRRIVEQQVNGARSEIEAAIQEYLTAGARSALGLCARRAGDTQADVSLFLEWDDVRKSLADKNSSPPAL